MGYHLTYLNFGRVAEQGVHFLTLCDSHSLLRCNLREVHLNVCCEVVLVLASLTGVISSGLPYPPIRQPR